jgi:dienelactone hydrolase
VPQPRGDGRLTRIVEPKTKRGYWLYLPKDYVDADASARRARRWPLVVTFHGMKPFDNAYPQAREWQQEADRYGLVVVAPEFRSPALLQPFPVRAITKNFKSDEQATLAILDHVVATTDADAGNVLATSWSSGGFLAHYMLNRHPDRFTCLAVYQSNYSETVLDASLTPRSVYHPLLIVMTERDFAGCIKQSRQAIAWYQRHRYKNINWIVIKDKGHERTPDMAADFFGRVARVLPNRAPEVLAERQAINGNPAGLAFFKGKMAQFQRPSTEVASRTAVARAQPIADPPRGPTPKRNAASNRNRMVRAVPQDRGAAATPRRGRNAPRRLIQRSPARIRVSSAIGIEPLHVAYWADCPADWRSSADFHWTLNGKTLGRGLAGRKTLTDAGEHTLGLLIVTADGSEHRASRRIRVIPRITASVGKSNSPDR